MESISCQIDHRFGCYDQAEFEGMMHSHVEEYEIFLFQHAAESCYNQTCLNENKSFA